MTMLYDPVAGFTDTDICAKSATRNGPSGKPDTETATRADGVKYVKTHSYNAAGQWISETAWVKQ